MGSTRIPYLCGGGDTPEQPAPEARWAPLDTHYGAWGCTPTRTTVPPRGHPLLPPNPQQPLRIPPAGPQGSMTPPMFMFLPPPNSLDEVFQEEPGIAQDLEEEGGAGGGGRRGGGGDTRHSPHLLPGDPRCPPRGTPGSGPAQERSCVTGATSLCKGCGTRRGESHAGPETTAATQPRSPRGGGTSRLSPPPSPPPPPCQGRPATPSWHNRRRWPS